ncbi:MAG: hypothetical protein EZS28_004451 [Streblomastix strix]|uniref:Uncharacterized protein n=1 Tax=Streblomastix strix TaxID=222440 RepID=A0A5J4X0M7_9EUKA|nr:MAG: hypothetical protein EZS28_004451 [Streblomastix strix]
MESLEARVAVAEQRIGEIEVLQGGAGQGGGGQSNELKAFQEKILQELRVLRSIMGKEHRNALNTQEELKKANAEIERLKKENERMNYRIKEEEKKNVPQQN